ncbi:MAG: nitrogen fixation protein NifX [Pseudomonadales bacterium]|nr:nitrogen fixation protein NifX [Pseudomonadales bacterium]
MSLPTRQLCVIDERHAESLLKVAFATTDRQGVDQHFGSARSLAIFGVSSEQQHLLSIVEFGDLNQDGHEDKLASKIAVLQGCIAVYCRACGGSAVRQLLALGIQPVKVAEDARISDLLSALQHELQEGPSGWLAKAMARQHQGEGVGRFDVMEAEGWQE